VKKKLVVSEIPSIKNRYLPSHPDGAPKMDKRRAVALASERDARIPANAEREEIVLILRCIVP
jgi:hypothetical protein